MEKIKINSDEYEKDGEYYCSKCNTKRTVTDPDSGKTFRCRCKCQMVEIKRQEQERANEIVAKHLKEMREKSLLGSRYDNMSFSSIEIRSKEHSAIIDRLKKYCEGFKNNNKGIGIFLYGNSGSGKTALTACMVDELIKQYIPCIVLNIGQIKAKMLQSTPSSQKSYLDYLYTIPVVFIDDFATENVKKNGEDNWVQEIIYDIINTRYNNMKPIIYTSNYSLNQCVEEKGVLEKTVDRIYESTVQIKLDLPSYRLKKKENLYF